MSNKDRWSALSMSERADFIKRAVEEGITERKSIIDTFNSLAEGGDTNSTESVPRSLMSKEEYLNSKRQEIIDKSLENSNNRTLPAVPYVINDIDEDIWRKNKETLLKEFQDKLGNLPEIHRDRATIVDTISKLQQELNAGPPSCVPGASCIYTATDNYGTKYRVSGNQSFRADPSKYGFAEISLNEVAPGDIIQDFGDKNIPVHAVTFMGYDKDNEALFNYSRGGADKKDIRKNSGYYLYSSEDLDYLPLNGTNNDKFKNAAAYRFVGTEDDNKQWDSEYVDYRQSYDKDWLEMAKKVQNITPTLLLETPQSTIITTSTKANGGRILDGKTEENQTVSNTPWYQQNIQPLSPLRQAINNANAEFKYKYSNIPKEELKEQLAKKEAGLVSEYIDKEGKAIFLPKDSSLMPLEQSIAEWLPGVGEVAELGYIASGLNNEDYLNAAIGAGLLFLPGNAGKLWKKGKEVLGLTKKASKATKVIRDPNLVTDVINTVDDDALMYLGNELPESAFKPKHNPLEDIKLQSKMDDFPAKVEKEIDLYSKLQKLLKREDYEGFKNMFFEGNTKELKEFLISKGVDESILTQPALERLQAARMYDILQNSSNPKQFALRSKPIDNPDFYRYKTFYDNQRHGVIDIHLNKIVSDISPEGPNVSMVKNVSSPHIKGASESAYNAVIKDLESVVTGKNLISPKFTTAVTDKYLDKILLGRFGMHGNVGNQPVYRLLKPTYDIPIKYIDEFGLDAVDDLGYFNIDFTKGPTYASGGRINRFDIGGGTTSTETNTQVVEEPTSSNPYKYSVLNIPYDRTAILNRQKPFYVTDENGNFVKGADGKVIPSVLGNILNTKLQPLRGIEGKYYYAPGSPHIGDSNKGGQPTSYDAEQFLLNWYNSPKTIDIIKKEARTYKTNVFQDIPYTDENGNTMMYSPTPEETVALRSRLASAVPEYKDVPMKDNTLAYYRPKSSITEAPPLNGEVFKVVQDRDGVNMYIGPSIQYGDNESESSRSWIPLHEKNHAFQHQLLPSYFNDKDTELEHDELKSEQHSYLMALRAALRLNPEKRDYTKEDAQQMIEAVQNVGGGSAGPNKLLKIINNDAGKLAYMLNTWAAADDPEEVKKELALKYSKGGRILDGKTKKMYGGNNDNFRSVAKMNARKLSSKTLK